MDHVECHHTRCFNPVYAKGVCRKHYDWERRGSAAPVSTQTCSVEGCAQQATRKGLCNTHAHRLWMHGTTASTRPADWGSKEAHPLYQRWAGLRRRPHHGRQAMADVWHNDFWAFVADIGAPPDNTMLRRLDLAYPLGPSNFWWKATDTTTDKAAYMRRWAARNPDKVLSSALKKKYGITLQVYEALRAAQGGVCAICGGQNEQVNSHGSIDRLVVDHCHNSQNVRGLLCHSCNRAIGLMKDDPARLRAAADYIALSR